MPAISVTILLAITVGFIIVHGVRNIPIKREAGFPETPLRL